eukprot:1121991-Rhodomonas_salina.5
MGEIERGARREEESRDRTSRTKKEPREREGGRGGGRGGEGGEEERDPKSIIFLNHDSKLSSLSWSQQRVLVRNIAQRMRRAKGEIDTCGSFLRMSSKRSPSLPGMNRILDVRIAHHIAHAQEATRVGGHLDQIGRRFKNDGGDVVWELDAVQHRNQSTEGMPIENDFVTLQQSPQTLQIQHLRSEPPLLLRLWQCSVGIRVV